MHINSYTKSQSHYKRALKVIPSGIYGHLGPAEGCLIPPSAYPFFSQRAQGSYFWDIDGNRFIDYMCAYGSNILGYGDPDVWEAVRRQEEQGNGVSTPSTIIIDLAELLVDTVDSADWVYFAKNGSDVIALAIRTARAYTRRKKLIFFQGGSHGTCSWAQTRDCPGILYEDIMNSIYIEWNNREQLEQTFRGYKNQIAAIIAPPYMHGAFHDSLLPAEGYWSFVRKLCDHNNTLLILDDTRTGFRIDLAGSDHYFGFKADLICFCSALANGYSLSALCGQDFLKNTVGEIPFTGSCWMNAVPFAAGLACISKMKKLNLPALLKNKGQKLTDSLKVIAEKHGRHLHVSGIPSLFYLRLADDDSLMLHQRWIAEMVKRGIFMTNHHNHFVNYTLSEGDIQTTLVTAEQAFQALQSR